MKAALLDTNVLLALAWPSHQHHSHAHTWFSSCSKNGWVTCAFTQLGFIRLSSNPAYTPDAVRPQEATALLQQWTRLKTHRYWSSPPANEPAIYACAMGHQQVNDAWLVEVASYHGGRLITLDTRISIHAGKTGLVEVIKT